jgi:hypothetical protein
MIVGRWRGQRRREKEVGRRAVVRPVAGGLQRRQEAGQTLTRVGLTRAD